MSAEQKETLLRDDIALMRFGFQFLKQSLFGEKVVPERRNACEKRLVRRQERQRQREAGAKPEGAPPA